MSWWAGGSRRVHRTFPERHRASRNHTPAQRVPHRAGTIPWACDDVMDDRQEGSEYAGRMWRRRSGKRSGCRGREPDTRVWVLLPEFDLHEQPVARLERVVCFRVALVHDRIQVRRQDGLLPHHPYREALRSADERNVTSLIEGIEHLYPTDRKGDNFFRGVEQSDVDGERLAVLRGHAGLTFLGLLLSRGEPLSGDFQV